MSAEHKCEGGESTPALTDALHDAHQDIMSLKAQIAELRWIESALRERTRELSERVKELDCLYAISDCLGSPTKPLDEILQAIASAIPSGFQFPKGTCVALNIAGQRFCSRGFRQSVHTRCYDLSANGRRIGTIQVFLSPSLDPPHGPAFLPEEDRLLHATAKWIGEIVEHRTGSIRGEIRW